EDEMRQLIASKPYADRILLWGDLPHPVTLRLMRDSDIVLRTTLYDGDSIAVHEALGLGTPVIATRNGMRPPGVRLIEMRDADGLQAAIEEILENPPPRKPEIAASNENIRAVYDLYRELLRPSAVLTPGGSGGLNPHAHSRSSDARRSYTPDAPSRNARIGASCCKSANGCGIQLDWRAGRRPRPKPVECGIRIGSRCPLPGGLNAGVRDPGTRGLGCRAARFAMTAALRLPDAEEILGSRRARLLACAIRKLAAWETARHHDRELLSSTSRIRHFK